MNKTYAKGPIANKGQPIRFVGGTYKKMTGWYNESQSFNPNPLRKNVIVDMGDGFEQKANVWRFSIRAAHKAPKSREEAMMQQHPDIEICMIEMCRRIASCEVHSVEGVLKLIRAELTDAINDQCQRGTSARWRKVHFGEEDRDMAVHAS